MATTHSVFSSLRSTITTLALLTALITPITAQVGTLLDQSQLPQCAYACPAVTNAQLVCVPPAAPVTSQATYQSCFCNSAYLTAFKGTAFVDLCPGICSTDDLNIIRTWYSNLCQGSAVVTPNINAAVAATATAATAATAATKAPAASSTVPVYNDGTSNGTWIQTHYNWLIFVIIIFLAAIAGIFFGLWLKKRHNRKVADLRNQESVLHMEEAARAIQSRHPSEMTLAPTAAARLSMRSRERLSGFTDAGSDYAAPIPTEPMPSSRPASMAQGVPASAWRSSDGHEKGRMTVNRVRDLGVGGNSASSSVPSLKKTLR